jgi:hypothetical protein
VARARTESVLKDHDYKEQLNLLKKEAKESTIGGIRHQKNRRHHNSAGKGKAVEGGSSEQDGSGEDIVDSIAKIRLG